MPKYQDISLIGSGGFGEVWECERDSDGARLAKKKLAASTDVDAKARFQKEVRILAKLDHPNIVRVIARHLQNEPFWYVMPLYAQSLDDDLANLVGEESRIHKVFGAILDAMEYAHDEGVIHRDLKPANVLMNSDDDVVVTDFGLGRIIDSQSTRLTSTGDWMGTVLYMAPEQLQDTKAADDRSDIFSLGRILYEICTGPLTSAIQDTTSVDPALAIIIDRCTRPDPDTRFQTVADLKKAWNAAIGVRDSLSDFERVKEISARLAATRRPADEDAIEALQILSRHSDDGDLVHDIVMELPGRAMQLMAENDLVRTRNLVEKFVTHITSQSWGFSYTDSIGNQCSKLFGAVDDPEIRANLLYCVVEVGVGHNRWHVMEIAKHLFETTHSRAESLAIAARFENAPAMLLRWIRENVSRAKLDDNLWELMEK